MIMYCEKCKKLISQSICPICGNKNIRIPEERDICFLVEKDHIWSGMLEDVLKQNKLYFVCVFHWQSINVCRRYL